MTIRILHGDCRDVLATLPDASVHCVVTSPPYWSLRDYGIEPSIWDDDPECDHEWGDKIAVNATNHTGKARWNHTRNGRDELQPVEKRVAWLRTKVEQGQYCQKCGAWAGAFGLEPTPELYVRHSVQVFAEVRRVLRDDGTLWLNLGDAYSSQGGRGEQGATTQRGGRANVTMQERQDSQKPPLGLKPKDLIGLPWMVAFALRTDGWYLRQDNIWAKRNCMPESVRDRTTRAHEYVFMLTKSQRYFYDAVAIEEDGDIPAGTRAAKGAAARSDLKHVNGRPPEYYEYTGKRNKRSVWHVATQPFAEAHFATMPPAIVETCVLAGSSEKGCCSACGAPWVRQTEKRDTGKTQKMTDGWDTGPGGHGTIHRAGREKGATGVPVTVEVTTGWLPSCECAEDVVPCTVLDPFGGAGTTGLVADRLGRDAILIELNADYIEIAERRIGKDPFTEKGLQARTLTFPGFTA